MLDHVVDRIIFFSFPSRVQTFPKHRRQTATKLAPNLRAKTNYEVHYQNLNYYLKQGMMLTKIHRVPPFTQSPWLKKYIDENAKSRSLSK